ncbi:MAG: D-alanyl-D-alanine carboxypeptidase [Clostridia bacterium]|nr:D-alanyl-D-alanine carboxypeptidase [Clostridia bacterium]
MRSARRAALLLALIIIISVFCAAFAGAEESSEASGTDSSAVSEEVSGGGTSQGGETAPDDPGIISGNAVVAYCLDDGQFIYTVRGDEEVAPTVAAKLMAMMVVYDIFSEKHLGLASTEVTVTSTAVSNSGNIADVRVPVMGLDVGDVYKAKDLVSASLVANANDACAALACYCGDLLNGNILTFVTRMNEKAKELGLEHTHFVNSNGLDAPDQVTTPKEAALIAAAFYRYNELVALSDVELFRFNESSVVRSKNYLKSNYYVAGYLHKEAIGLIAGQKDKNGDYCLLTATQKDGRTYILNVMCASGMLVDADRHYSFGFGNAYTDMHKLIDWVRVAFEYVKIASADRAVGELRVNAGDSVDHVLVVPAADVERLIVRSKVDKITHKLVYDDELVFKTAANGSEYDTVNAPVARGQKVGTVTYYCDGEQIAAVDAVTKEAVDSNELLSMWDKFVAFLKSSTMKTILIVLGVIIVLYVIVAVVSAVFRGAKKVKGKGGKGKRGGKGGSGGGKTKALPEKSMHDTREA